MKCVILLLMFSICIPQNISEYILATDDGEFLQITSYSKEEDGMLVWQKSSSILSAKHKIIPYSKINNIKDRNGNVVWDKDNQNIKERKGKTLRFAQNLPPQSKIKMMTEKQKQLLYEKYEINPYLNMIFPIPPFTGYYRVGHLTKGIVKYFVLFLGGMFITGLGSFDRGEFHIEETYTERINATGNIVLPILIFDVYLQTKKYNKNLYKSIYGTETPSVGTIKKSKVNDTISIDQYKELEILFELKETGVITDEEFEKKKLQILGLN